jgi:hypothetical protein
VRPGSLQPSRWPTRDWPAALDPWLPVWLGSLGAVVWLENKWRAAPDPSGSVAAKPACSPRCALSPLRFFGAAQVLDGKRLRWRRRDTALPAREVPQRLAPGLYPAIQGLP